MMTQPLLTLRRQGQLGFFPPLKSFAGACVLALAAFLVVGLAPPALAQTLDQAVSGALDNNCAGLNGPFGTYGPNLAGLCAFPSSSGAQLGGGSVTAQTRLGATVEEQRVLRRLEEERRKIAKGSEPGSRIALLGAQSDPWTLWQLQGIMVASADPQPPTVTAEKPKFAPGEVGEPFWRKVGVWGSGEYEAFDKDVTTFEPGYDSNTWRGTLGADYSFSDQFIAGLAFNYSHVDGDFDNSGGDFETHSYGGLVYASVLPARNFFIDIVAGYARKDYSIDRGISFSILKDSTVVPVEGVASGDTDGNEYKVGVNVGYDFIIKNITIGPRVGVNYRHTDIDSFTEKGTTGLELAYGDQDETSLTTNLGVFASVAISTDWGVLIPQVSAEWVHEFKDDQRTIEFHFVEDLNPTPTILRFQNDTPDRNYANVGAGVVAVLPGGFVPFVNYRAQVGYEDQSSHAVVVGLRYEF